MAWQNKQAVRLKARQYNHQASGAFLFGRRFAKRDADHVFVPLFTHSGDVIMSKVTPYTIRMPYETCEKLMNNETVSEAVAARRKLQRTLNSRILDGRAIAHNAHVDTLKTGQVYKERCFVVDPGAGKMQRAFGFHQWQQDFKIEKTGVNTAKCIDSLIWKQTGSTAYRTYTIRGSGDAAVIMSLNPWVINLQNVSFEGMIRKRMEKEMSAADAQFPAICESAARQTKRAA